MIFSKPLSFLTALGYLLYTALGSAYEININGQTFQVNVINPGGEFYADRTSYTDDYGEPLDPQSNAICSSLRGEQCSQVTNNGAKTHNLFNYFPNHKEESIVAHANSKYDRNTSPYLLKQPLDDRTLDYLSQQNIHSLGTKPIKPKIIPNRHVVNNDINDIAQTLLHSVGNNVAMDPLKLVGSKRIKHKKRKKKNNNVEPQDPLKEDNVPKNAEMATENEVNGEQEDYDDVEVEFYSSLGGDGELANALNLDDEEFGETVDRIVAQLVASYLDNDSEEVDVSQIFANELSVDEVEQFAMNEEGLQEMNELLTNIARKHKEKEKGINEDGEAAQNEIFAVKFVVGSEKNKNEQDEYNQIQQDKQGENENLMEST